MTLLLVAAPNRQHAILAADDLLIGADGGRHLGSKVMPFPHSRVVAAASGDVLFGRCLMARLASCPSYEDALILLPAIWPVAATEAANMMSSSALHVPEAGLFAEIVVVGLVPSRHAFESVVLRGHGDALSVRPIPITQPYINCGSPTWGDAPERDPQSGDGMATLARWALVSMSDEFRCLMGRTLHVVEMRRCGATVTVHDLSDA